MSSINEHIITLQKELRNINIPSTFIEEFLDNYLDQLESMKEEIMSEEKVGLQEAENIVLNQCDPIIDVINRVLETYDSRETPAILSPGSIISFIAILRVLVISQLFSFYFNVHPFSLFQNIPTSQIYFFFYSTVGDNFQMNFIVPIITVILFVEAFLLKKAEEINIGYGRFEFLVDQSIFKAYYRVILILFLVPALLPFYIFHDLQPPMWILRALIFVNTILAISSIEWLLGITKEINLRQLSKELNPFTIFISYSLMSIIIYFFFWRIKHYYETITSMLVDRYPEIDFFYYDFLYVVISLSLLFIIGLYGFWKSSIHRERAALKNHGKYILIWILIVTFFSLIFLLKKDILNVFFPIWGFYDEIIQTTYILIFFFISILFIVNIPQFKTYSVKLWILFGWILYTTTVISALSFQLSVHNFIIQNLYLNYEIYLNFFQSHLSVIIFLCFMTFIISVLVLYTQKQHLTKDHSSIQIFAWLFRSYLFFLAYEMGVVNLFIYQLGNIFQLLTNPAIRAIWIILLLIVLLFLSLEGILELVMLRWLNYQSGLVKLKRALF